MVAGEYAVLEPNQQLIVTAVNRFIYVTIKASPKNRLTLENFKLNQMKWKHINNEILLDVEDDRTSFVRAAMEVTLNYLSEQSLPIKPISITVKSELDDDSGVKYGLGSSAAVVTGVVSALLTKFCPEKSTDELVFKLAAIAHVNVQKSGSGADIAASTYGGMLQYSSFQAEWLLDKIEQFQRITDLVNTEWEFLTIKKLHFPDRWKMLVGWTGYPASTVNLVGKIAIYKLNKPTEFKQFITDSSQAVDQILLGIEDQDLELFYKGITANRQCLAKMGERAQVDIETTLLKKLSDIAIKFEGAGKLSGAGGGDCGIAFSSSHEQLINIKQTWRKAGIKPLQITKYPHGAMNIY